MNRLIHFLFFVSLFAACTTSTAQRNQIALDRPAPDTGFTWSRVTENAVWNKSYNFQMFVMNGKLWVFHHDGVWSSENGRDWTRSGLNNVIANQGFLDYVIFRGSVYGLGHLEGNIERFTFKPEIYRTTDLKRWETLSSTSNLPRRFFYHPFVFNGKIWLIGGEDKERKYADIWNSKDGIAWTKVKDDLPFGPRSNSQVVELNGQLYLLNNDVWLSKDALNWERVTDSIVKGVEIFGYAAVVFDNKIWLLGCNRNGQFASQVLASSDGKNWESFEAPWSPRGGVAAAVFDGKIYLTGGKYGGTPDQRNIIYSNDLWTLEKRSL